MTPRDINSTADAVRWLRHYVEWTSKASEAMARRAVDVLTRDGWPAHDPACDVLDVDPAIGRPVKPCNCKAPVDTRALKQAAEALHRIVMAMSARRLKARAATLTLPMVASIEKQSMTDSQVEDLAGDAFEAVVLALRDAGDPEATVFECGKDDIPP